MKKVLALRQFIERRQIDKTEYIQTIDSKLASDTIPHIKCGCYRRQSRQGDKGNGQIHDIEPRRKEREEECFV